MFGIGLPEMILIMAVALIVVGPEKLPEMAKTLARQFFELKKAAMSLKEEFTEESEDDDKPWDKANSVNPQVGDLLKDNFERAQPPELLDQEGTDEEENAAGEEKTADEEDQRVTKTPPEEPDT
jgi:sec-independent protein translocase protein TatB